MNNGVEAWKGLERRDYLEGAANMDQDADGNVRARFPYPRS